MPSPPQYVVQTKEQTRWVSLGPFGDREEAERALQQAVKRHRVTYARLLSESRSEEGKPLYQALRVFQRRQSRFGQGVGAKEWTEPVAQPSPPVAAVEAEVARPGMAALQLASLNALIQVVSHRIVYYEPGEFSAWPANNGGQAWHWGDELLIGFVNGTYEEKEGHNWAPPLRSLLARSTDGGATWTSSEPSFGDAGPGPERVNFAHPDFALRVFDETESYYISYDRGRTWPGPYGFGDLFTESPVAGDEFSSRTDYIVESSSAVLFFMSSRRELIFTEDYSYVAKTSDGGASFAFVSFIDLFDLDRNVMPSTVRVSDTGLVSCLRRKDDDSHWIEAYRSNDNGGSWTSLGQVDSTGENNGNPAALVRLPNGYLVCVYGIRQPRGTSRISAKVSADNGATWSLEHRLRDDFVGADAFGDVDLGYPRAFVRPDGNVVAVYYWATTERPEQHIAATNFRVVPRPPIEIGAWQRSLLHEAASGKNRLLLFTLHYVESGSRFKKPKAVRYGGQTMTKVLERDQEESDKRTYVSMFYLTEDDIRKAADARFRVDWDPNRPDNWEAASVFLANVDQNDPFGDKDTGAIKAGNQVACHTFASVPAGDALMLAGTARQRGRFGVAKGFVKADEFDLARGGARKDGDGVVGHRLVTDRSDERALIEHSNPGTMVIACLQVRQQPPSVA